MHLSARWLVVVAIIAGGACDKPLAGREAVPEPEVRQLAAIYAPPIEGSTGPILICPNGCNDNNPCTDDACVDGFCEHYPNSGLICNDLDACTYGERCVEGKCVASGTVMCPDDQCNDRACDGRGGCTRVPKTGLACNDNQPCTYGEQCDANGGCGGGFAIICKGDQCTDRSCNGTSRCTERPRTGERCEDGEACTGNDSCDAAGVCRAGAVTVCQGDACNTRVCDGAGGCRVTPRIGAVCNDGEPCTFGDTCDAAGTCKGGGTITCVSDTCNARVCNGTNTCKVTHRVGTRCDDGIPCSFDDACAPNGTCTGTPIVCTSDETAERSCNGSPTCTVKPRPGAGCDDNNPCTQGDVRLPDGSCRGTPYTCAVDACLVASVCDGRGGCRETPKPDDSPCDADQSLCTPQDVCRGGVCVPDPRPVKCIERDCNTVACNGTTGNCDYQPTSGDACGVSGCFSEGTCDKGLCSGQAKDCSAFNGACTEGICDAVSGNCVAAAKPNGSNCSPGGLCTAQAACAFGVCELPPAACPAATSACKAASCDPADGKCGEVARPVGSPCDPKNSCISDAACDATGACIGTPAANGDPCTAEGGQIGQCVSGRCVSASPTPPTPGADGGVAGSPDAGNTPPSAPRKSGCAYGGAGANAGGWGLFLLALGAAIWRRRR